MCCAEIKSPCKGYSAARVLSLRHSRASTPGSARLPRFRRKSRPCVSKPASEVNQSPSSSARRVFGPSRSDSLPLEWHDTCRRSRGSHRPQLTGAFCEALHTAWSLQHKIVREEYTIFLKIHTNCVGKIRRPGMLRERLFHRQKGTAEISRAERPRESRPGNARRSRRTYKRRMRAHPQALSSITRVRPTKRGTAQHRRYITRVTARARNLGLHCGWYTRTFAGRRPAAAQQPPRRPVPAEAIPKCGLAAVLAGSAEKTVWPTPRH